MGFAASAGDADASIRAAAARARCCRNSICGVTVPAAYLSEACFVGQADRPADYHRPGLSGGDTAAL